jgi:hypothetical protein
MVPPFGKDPLSLIRVDLRIPRGRSFRRRKVLPIFKMMGGQHGGVSAGQLQDPPLGETGRNRAAREEDQV